MSRKPRSEAHSVNTRKSPVARVRLSPLDPLWYVPYIALAYAHFAAGRFDAFWEQHLKPWDVAAGALMVSEAGGRISGMDGSPFDPAAAHLVASNGRIHDDMVRVIREFRTRAPKRTM